MKKTFTQGMRVVACAWIGLGAVAAQADDTLFSCTTTTGKEVRISRVAKGYQYQFGTRNHPELRFTTSTGEAEVSTCSASNGDGAQASISLPNGDYLYTATANEVRSSHPAYVHQGNLVVSRKDGDKPVAKLICKRGTVVHKLHDLSNVSSSCG